MSLHPFNISFLCSRMLALFLKSSNTGLQLNKRLQHRETALAWISLGLLDLARATRAQTTASSSNCASTAKPLFGKYHRVSKTTQRHLLQSEACFQRALGTAQKSLSADCQLLALAWFGLGSVYAITKG